MFLMVPMGLLFMLAFMMPSGAGNRETADEPEVETEVVQLVQTLTEMLHECLAGMTTNDAR